MAARRFTYLDLLAMIAACDRALDEAEHCAPAAAGPILKLHHNSSSKASAGLPSADHSAATGRPAFRVSGLELTTCPIGGDDAK